MSKHDTKMTPMMRQYMEIKKKHQGEILFFRMGDFYEMFFDDAQVAARILDIALTSRQNDIPMCGIPYHAAESYIARLVKAGKNIAICEQLEKVPSDGTIVKREVVRVITPGTVVEPNLLPSDDHNFLCSCILQETEIGLAMVDLSTGDFFLTTLERTREAFRAELARYRPGEIILRDNESAEDTDYLDIIHGSAIPVSRINHWLYDKDYLLGIIKDTFGVVSEKGLGLTTALEILAAGSILQYIQETQKQAAGFLKHPRVTRDGTTMVLDEATVNSLELTSNSLDGSRERTLFAVLNRTKTAMGRRLLERLILEPLVSSKAINTRLDQVQYFHQFHDLSATLRDELSSINDIERIVSRFSLGKVFPRNFIALVQSLEGAASIREILEEQPEPGINKLGRAIPGLGSLVTDIRDAVDDDPALTPEQGPVIRRGFNPELDRLYEIKTSGKEWILAYQEEEKKRLDIPTLKVKYNKILGYYIEISKAQSAKAPEDYLRKQTLVGSERYTTEKLQNFERDILSSSDKIIELENQEINRLTGLVQENRRAIQETASAIAYLDVIQSLATSALENRFTRPQVDDAADINVREGRHPVVEKFHTSQVFIPNDITLDGEENLVKLITGPNMSGKSTYIRMAAIIQLMSQVGSFVPAESARCGVVDRVFTRIGASDNISRGESTFLVEMNETAAILNNATERSLVIMDEVGRGTSTYDGLSIAWAIVEYILRYTRSKTLFATHYHELTELGKKKGIENYNVMVRESVQGVEFMHKVVRGSADKSYGIHVARLAGIPKQVVSRADALLKKLEATSSTKQEKNDPDEQLEIFNAANHRVIQAIKDIDIDDMKPVDALNELNRLKNLIANS